MSNCIRKLRTIPQRDSLMFLLKKCYLQFSYSFFLEFSVKCGRKIQTTKNRILASIYSKFVVDFCCCSWITKFKWDQTVYSLKKFVEWYNNHFFESWPEDWRFSLWIIRKMGKFPSKIAWFASSKLDFGSRSWISRDF